MSTSPETEITLEANILIDELKKVGVLARLLGGLGIAAHDHDAVPEQLQREYADIDIVIGKRDGRGLSKFLLERGYFANEKFNALHGAKRMLFYDKSNSRQMDVFIGSFDMCHYIELDKYLSLHEYSLAPEHLLLTKLQIVELNQKDLVDVLRLLLMHKNKDSFKFKCPGISVENLNSVLCFDWGWYTTVTDNLLKVQSRASQILNESDSQFVVSNISEILEQINGSSKSLKWKARATVGRHKIWYEIPEEISGK